MKKENKIELNNDDTVVISYSSFLERYFGMLPNCFEIALGKKSITVVNVSNPRLRFDGWDVDCPSNIHFVDSRQGSPLHQALGNRLVELKSPGKIEQTVLLAKYNRSAYKSPNFKFIPTEFISRLKSSSMSGAAYAEHGMVIKAISASDGLHQILIKPQAGKILPPSIVNDIYYWSRNSSPEPRIKITEGDTKALPPPAAKESQQSTEKFLEKMESLGYVVHCTDENTQFAWLGEVMVQPLIDVKEEYRAFVRNGRVVNLMRRPRNGDENYEQLAKGPDITLKPEDWAGNALVEEFVKELPKFVSNMGSADVFITNDGKWGVFEFGLGYSPVAADFMWIAQHYKTLVIDEIKKRFK